MVVILLSIDCGRFSSQVNSHQCLQHGKPFRAEISDRATAEVEAFTYENAEGTGVSTLSQGFQKLQAVFSRHLIIRRHNIVFFSFSFFKPSSTEFAVSTLNGPCSSKHCFAIFSKLGSSSTCNTQVVFPPVELMTISA